MESALTLLLVFTLLLGLMESGRFLNVQQALTDAARAGARLAVTPITQTSTLPSDAEITTVAQNVLDSATIKDGTVGIERRVIITANGINGEYTRVTVTVPYNLITTSMFSSLKVTLTGEALMRNETSP